MFGSIVTMSGCYENRGNVWVSRDVVRLLWKPKECLGRSWEKRQKRKRKKYKRLSQSLRSGVIMKTQGMFSSVVTMWGYLEDWRNGWVNREIVMKTKETFGSVVRLWWRGKKRLGQSWDCDEEERNVWVSREIVMKREEKVGSIVRLWWRGKNVWVNRETVMKMEKCLGHSWDCDEEGKNVWVTREIVMKREETFGSFVRLWWRGKKPRLGQLWDCGVIMKTKGMFGSVVTPCSYHEDGGNIDTACQPWWRGFITKTERTSGSLWCYRGNVCVSPIMSQRVHEYWTMTWIYHEDRTMTWTYHEDRKNVWVTLMLQRERLREPNNVSESPRILNDDLDLSWRQRKHLGQPWRRALILETDDRNIWVSQKTWRGKMTQMKNQGHHDDMHLSWRQRIHLGYHDEMHFSWRQRKHLVHHDNMHLSWRQRIHLGHHDDMHLSWKQRKHMCYHDDMHLSWRQTIKTSGLLGRRGLTIKTEEISGSPCKH